VIGAHGAVTAATEAARAADADKALL